jgi:hypothetical protein
MTREDIIRMARQAGFPDYAMGLASEDAWQKTELFAALVAAAEREACAEICDAEASIEGIAQRCATKIRARGSK